MSKKILVTGGCGKLGYYVSSYLAEKGFQVTNFDINHPDDKFVKRNATIPFIRGNLNSLGDCMRAVAHAQADAIVHLGAITYNTELQPPYAKEYDLKRQDGVKFIQRQEEDEAIKTNTMGTYYLMDAARRLGVKKVVMASTYFVLGLGFRLSKKPFIPKYLPIDEEHPCAPEDTYSLSKYMAEEILKAFSRAYDIKTISLRLVGIYYPDIETYKKIYQFNKTIDPINNKEEGYIVSTTYQYVDARDAARAVELSLDVEGLNDFEAFFIATDTLYSEPTANVIAKRWPSLVEMGKDIKGTDGIISIEKAKKLLGYKPCFSWRNNVPCGS